MGGGSWVRVWRIWTQSAWCVNQVEAMQMTTASHKLYAVISIISTLIILEACSIGPSAPSSSSGTATVPVYPSSITAEILSASRSRNGNINFETWELDIWIGVQATGDITGNQYSTLKLYGDEDFAQDTDYWSNTSVGIDVGEARNAFSHEVAAKYIPGGVVGDDIVIEIKSTDWSHPSAGKVIYTRSIPIEWIKSIVP